MISTSSTALLGIVLALSSAIGEEPPVPAIEPHNELSEMSLAEINSALENPLTSLWSLTFEGIGTSSSGDLIDGNTEGSTLFFQPGLPVPLGDDMTFISRPVFPLVTNPILDPQADDGVSGHKTGFGDIQMLSLIGPDKSKGLVWGLGGTFKFPTASDDLLGAGKWQAGPSAMLFNFSKPWTIGLLAEHWWSFAGDSERLSISQTDVKYTIRYALPNAWSIGCGPTISANWMEDNDNRWTVPIGLGLSKTTKIGNTPVKMRLETHYSVIRPDDYGTEWKLLFRIAPVIPSPYKR